MISALAGAGQVGQVVSRCSGKKCRRKKSKTSWKKSKKVSWKKTKKIWKKNKKVSWKKTSWTRKTWKTKKRRT